MTGPHLHALLLRYTPNSQLVSVPGLLNWPHNAFQPEFIHCQRNWGSWCSAAAALQGPPLMTCQAGAYEKGRCFSSRSVNVYMTFCRHCNSALTTANSLQQCSSARELQQPKSDTRANSVHGCKKDGCKSNMGAVLAWQLHPHCRCAIYCAQHTIHSIIYKRGSNHNVAPCHAVLPSGACALWLQLFLTLCVPWSLPLRVLLSRHEERWFPPLVTYSA